MPTPFFFAGDARQGTPVSLSTASAATWRGTSLAPRRAFALLPGQTFSGRANGRFSAVDNRGPLVGATRGAIAVHFRMGSGASTVVLIQSSYSSTSSPLITVGVNASGQAVGSFQDAAGTTVAEWEATSMNEVAEGGSLLIHVLWDSFVPINGAYHVAVIVKGVVMPSEDFTTAPITPWTPFPPQYITTGYFCETGFDGEMILTQGSVGATALVSTVLRSVGMEAVTITLPSLQLSGGFTVTVGDLVGALVLPSLQLSGEFTVTP